MQRFFTCVYDKAFSNIFMKLWNKNMKYDFPQRWLWVMEEIQLSHLSHRSLHVRVCVFARLLWIVSEDCYISTGFNRWVHGWRDDIRKRSSRLHACCRLVCVWTRVCVNVSFTDGRSLKEISLASLPYDEHRQNIPNPWRNKQLR